MFSFEKEFIEKLLSRDHAAFDIFYVQTVDVFFRYIKSHFSLQDADIHDVLADVFCKIRAGLDKYKKEYDFERYIWTILKNTLKDFFKKTKEINFSYYEIDKDIGLDEILMSDDDIALWFQEQCVREEVETTIKTLDLASQELLHFRFVEQKSYDDIARITGVSAQSLRKKLSRIVSNLRNKLGKL